jgi:hypothetical protein
VRFGEVAGRGGRYIVRALTDPAERKVLILGAGAWAAGELALAGAARVTIADLSGRQGGQSRRSPSRQRDLVRDRRVD